MTFENQSSPLPNGPTITQRGFAIIEVINGIPIRRKHVPVKRRKGIDKEKQRERIRLWSLNRSRRMRDRGLSTSPKRWGMPIRYPRYTAPSLSQSERQRERQRRYRQRNLEKGLTTNGTARIVTGCGKRTPLEMAWREFKETGEVRVKE